MTNSVDANRGAAAGILIGGAGGALVGAKIAPSVLGKIDVDRALTRTPYTDIVRDKIATLGEASCELFSKQRSEWFNEMDDINSVYKELLPGRQIQGQYDGNYVTLDKEETVTAKELKKLLQGINDKFSTRAERIVNFYKKHIEILPDEKVLNADDLKAFLIKNSPIREKSKKAIQEFIDSLPKQKGKYAAVIGAVGAIAAGAIGYIISSFQNKEA